MRRWRCVARRWPWGWLCVGRVLSLLSPPHTLEISLTLVMCWRRTAPHRFWRSVNSVLMVKGHEVEVQEQALVCFEDIFCFLLSTNPELKESFDCWYALPWFFWGGCSLGTDIKLFFCLQLQNSSAVAVGFRVQMASLSPSRPQCGADRVPFLLGSYTDSKVQPTVGKM